MNIDEMIKKAFINPINDKLKTIGVEIEMPIVSKKINIDMNKIQEMFKFLLSKEFMICSKDNKKNIISVCNLEGDKISLEYSINTLEFSINKSDNLFELFKKYMKYFNIINEFLKKFEYELVGAGINPNYKVINRKCLDDNYYKAIEKLLLMKPYKNNKLFGEFCSYCCSTQTHIVPEKENVVKYLNVFNNLVDIKENIFSNSYMSELNCNNSRKILWENSNFGNYNTGKIPTLKDKKDILEMYKNSYINIIKRNNEYIILPKIKVEEYFKLKEIEGLTVNDKKIKIIPIENDFDRYRSYRNVELSRYGTIEIRSDCTQNINNIFNVVAFNVGISANIDEAFNKLKEKDTDERCWFKIAKKGLIRRKKGEEIFLNVGDNV